MAPRRPPESSGSGSGSRGRPSAGRSRSAADAGTDDARRGAVPRRRVTIGLVATVIAIGVLFVGVFPASTWWKQRQATATAEAELRQVRAERERVQRETERLTTPEEIEKRARAEFGFQKPGEEIYNVLPAPAEPIGLPDSWPFVGVERALGAQ